MTTINHTSANNQVNGAAHQTANEIQFHAQPYNLDATGFYFSDYDEFESKQAACRDSFGNPVDEFEIQFINGSSEAAALFSALNINQANIAEFIELIDERTESEWIGIAYLADLGYSFGDAINKCEEVSFRECRLEDAATELFDECHLHEIPERLQAYIDYSAFAYDCRVSGDLVEFELAGSTYTITNSNEF